MDDSKFKELHFAQALGTTLENGMQYTFVTLQRNHARRGAMLRNVLEEYNRTVDIPLQVAPVPVPPNLDAIVPVVTACKVSNVIVARIQSDAVVRNGRSWQWPVAEVSGGAAVPVASVKMSVRFKSHACKKGLTLSGMVKELGLDPIALNMQAAEDHLCTRYLSELKKGPDFNGVFDEEDADFLFAELRMYFSTELSFSVAPAKYRKDTLPPHVRASLDGWMGDCIDGCGKMPFSVPVRAEPAYVLGGAGTRRRKQILVTESKPPQAIIIDYFKAMLPQWEHTVTLDAKDVVIALNRNQPIGVYKTVDACSFMRPFVHAGCVELYRVIEKEHQFYEFVVDVEKVRAFLEL